MIEFNNEVLATPSLFKKIFTKLLLVLIVLIKFDINIE